MTRIKKTPAILARGKVISSSEFQFKVSRNVDKIDKKTDLEKKIRVGYTFKKDEFNVYEQPFRNANVLLLFRDKKSKDAKYYNEERNKPYKVMSLAGKIYYSDESEFF